MLEQMERYQLDLLVAPGSGQVAVGAALPAELTGLAVEGDGVVLSALRRRGGWLELRLACQQPTPSSATIAGPVLEAREADLLGRPGPALPLKGDTLPLNLAAWEITTVQLRLAGTVASGDHRPRRPPPEPLNATFDTRD